MEGFMLRVKIAAGRIFVSQWAVDSIGTISELGRRIAVARRFWTEAATVVEEMNQTCNTVTSWSFHVDSSGP